MWIPMRYAAVLAVLSCGLTGLKPAGAATLPARAPGLWQSTTTVTDASGTPMANATNVITLSCVDAATDIKFFTSGESACTALEISGSGSTYAIDGTCTQQGKQGNIHETLDYADAQNVTLIAKLNTASGRVTVTSHLQQQGACLAGMVPGDEGDVVNGLFSKADNIDDQANQ